MYEFRVLFLLALISFVEPHFWCRRHPERCPHRHNDYRRRHEERDFDRLANDIIEADHKEKVYCYRDQEISAKEVYGEEIYKFVTTLPNFNEGTMEVKIKHRVLFIKAERDNEYKKYVNVKILPQMLNLTAAEWSYGNGELTVALPYKNYVKEESPLACDNEINANTINISKVNYNLNEPPLIDIRFQDDPANITDNAV